MSKKIQKRALASLGNQYEAADKINALTGKNVSQPDISRWINQYEDGIPPEYCPAVEYLTGGKYPKERLRPDVFDPKYLKTHKIRRSAHQEQPPA